MSDELLSILHLTSGYEALQILWDISLHVGSGEYVAVLGSNGVGKSTLLKTIAGTIRATAGQIVWTGRDVTWTDAPFRVRRGISLVPEGKRLFAGMTVRENLLMGAFMRRDRERIKEDLDSMLGLFPSLRDKLDRVAGTLSGGEQQMCAIGRGLMAAPRLLLLDEPSFGLAPAVTDDLLKAITGINREGVAVILVEQDVFAALQYAHRGYVIDGGRIVMEGSSHDLLADPLVRKNYLGL